MSMRHKHHDEIVKAYEDWFSKFNWAWMCTLTFKRPMRTQAAEKRLGRWLQDLQMQAGRKDFRYVCVKERGAYDDHLHFHLLIGGLKKGKDFSRWQQEWERKEGSARVLPFNGNKQGISYLLKTFLPDRDFEVKISLSEQVPA